MATVSALLTYPVKGCAGTEVSEAALTPAGLAHDRSFLVTDPEGIGRTQRRDRRLALIRPRIEDDGGRLVLAVGGRTGGNADDGGDVDDGPDAGDGGDVLTVEVDTAGPRRPVDVLGRPMRGIDQGERAAAWLSEVLGVPSRLVRVPPEHDRITDGLTPGTCGYADSAAVLVVSRSSLAGLNDRITRRGGEAVPMSRFRPNVIVDGWAEPHTEDRVRRLAVADAELGYAKPALRCAVVLVDQRTGAPAGPEPLRTLADYRRAEDGKTAFGAKFAVPVPGRVAVGDAVTVTAWAEGRRPATPR